MEFAQVLRAKSRAYVKSHGRRLLQAIDRYLARSSLVGDHPFFDPDLFPYNQTSGGKLASDPLRARPAAGAP